MCFKSCEKCIHSELDDRGSIFAPRIYVCDVYGCELDEDTADECNYYETMRNEEGC